MKKASKTTTNRIPSPEETRNLFKKLERHIANFFAANDVRSIDKFAKVGLLYGACRNFTIDNGANPEVHLTQELVLICHDPERVHKFLDEAFERAEFDRHVAQAKAVGFTGEFMNPRRVHETIRKLQLTHRQNGLVEPVSHDA